MADTSVQGEAERYIRQHILPDKYGCEFEKRVMRLKGGGEFAFDAVSTDGKIVACISTSSGYTASGKRGTAKLFKIRSDVLWFYMLPQMPPRALLVFTDQTMIDLVEEELTKGRFPKDLEIVKVDLPEELAKRVRASQEQASREVMPTKK